MSPLPLKSQGSLLRSVWDTQSPPDREDRGRGEEKWDVRRRNRKVERERERETQRERERERSKGSDMIER